MFFQITSENRHAARRLLTKYGHPSDVVRNLRNGQLGKTIYEDVQAGRIPMSEAAAAVTAVLTSPPESDIPEPFVMRPSQSTSPAMPAQTHATTTEFSEPVEPSADTLGAANQMAVVLETLMRSATPKAKSIDADEVKAIVAEMLKSTEGRVATIEIKVGGAVVGKVDGKQHPMFEDIVMTVSTRKEGRRLHAWLAGPSGSGKSFLAYQVAKALNLNYYGTSAIQSKYDLIGFVSPTGDEKTLRTPFRNAFENGGVFAWDDIDGSAAGAFVAFNEALGNGRFAFPDKIVEQHTDFVCIASANTWGTGATADYVGRNKIDAATLSRFIRIPVDYDEQLERDIVGNHEWARFVQRVRLAVQKEGIKVLVTPRATYDGYALLQAGMKREKVERYTLFAGLDADVVARLREAI